MVMYIHEDVLWIHVNDKGFLDSDRVSMTENWLYACACLPGFEAKDDKKFNAFITDCIGKNYNAFISGCGL